MNTVSTIPNVQTNATTDLVPGFSTLQSSTLQTVTLFNESFGSSDVSNPFWVSGVVQNSDRPFLTARSTDIASPGGLLGAPTVQLDTEGDGTLRLTNAKTDQAAFVLLNQAISTQQDISIAFDFFAYGDTGADGVSLVLLDGSKPVPTVAGGFGGSLGYAPRNIPNSLAGLAGSYLAVGFDGYGNFSNDTEGRNNGVGFTPNAVAVRDSEAIDYQYLTGSTVPFSIDNPRANATRDNSLRKARIDLTPEGVLTVTVQADLNQDSDFNDTNETVTPIDAFDVVAKNGVLPSTLKLGLQGQQVTYPIFTKRAICKSHLPTFLHRLNRPNSLRSLSFQPIRGP